MLQSASTLSVTGDVVVTNDGATILKQLEVQHPAAKVLVDLSDLQVVFPTPQGNVKAGARPCDSNLLQLFANTTHFVATAGLRA